MRNKQEQVLETFGSDFKTVNLGKNIHFKSVEVGYVEEFKGELEKLSGTDKELAGILGKALVRAAELGHIKIVKILLDSNKVRYITEDAKFEALQYASLNNKKDVVDLILNHENAQDINEEHKKFATRTDYIENDHLTILNLEGKSLTKYLENKEGWVLPFDPTTVKGIIVQDLRNSTADEDLKYIAETFPKIEYLDFRNVIESTDDGLKFLYKLKYLKHLKINENLECKITQQGIVDFARYFKAAIFNFWTCKSICEGAELLNIEERKKSLNIVWPLNPIDITKVPPQNAPAIPAVSPSDTGVNALPQSKAAGRTAAPPPSVKKNNLTSLSGNVVNSMKKVINWENLVIAGTVAADSLKTNLQTNSAWRGFVNCAKTATDVFEVAADKLIKTSWLNTQTQTLLRKSVKSSAPIILVIASARAFVTFCNDLKKEGFIQSFANATGVFLKTMVEGGVSSIMAAAATTAVASLEIGAAATALPVIAAIGGAVAGTYVAKYATDGAKFVCGKFADRIMKEYNNYNKQSVKL